MKRMMSMIYIMVLIKKELCDIIFVVPILARLVPSFHHNFFNTLRKNVVTVQLLLSKLRMFLIICYFLKLTSNFNHKTRVRFCSFGL